MKEFRVTDDASFAEIHGRIAHHGDTAAASSAIQQKLDAAKRIVEAVRTEGDSALARFNSQFDKVELAPEQFEVSAEEIDAAVGKVEPAMYAILERAHEHIRRFHGQHLQKSWEEAFPDGTILGQRVTAIESAGVYVPGGTAFYPSSVLMNIVPARVAGVPEIIMVSPPSYAGGIHPIVLAAAKLAGATRVFRIGGAQAIAALAFGTETIPAVAKITGPGNTFVAAAKGLVSNVVSIDSEAGPSEVVVIADETANPAYAAAEMLSQAVHDPDAMSVLITTSEQLIPAVYACLESEIENLPRKDIIQRSLDDHGLVILVRDLGEAIALTNLYAPEHLNIQTEHPRRVADQITNAGAIMIGNHTPVAVGDYYAGPNHILPTGRRARFASPLSAEDFRKVSSILYYSAERLRNHGDDIQVFANVEELQAHARSIAVRLEEG